jgi:hypothetical protein
VLGNSGDFPGACKLERTTLIVVKWLAQDLCAGSAYSSLVVIEVLALSVVDPDENDANYLMVRGFSGYN